MTALPRPTRLLGQNSELRADGIWNWSLPAWAGRFPNGTTYNTCPSAGVCAKACYARNGTYLFPTVLLRHQLNLAYVLTDLDGWKQQMIAELAHPRHREGWVRIHDSGDFFSDAYLQAWLDIARAHPDVGFYCYTKEVDRFRRLVEPDPPGNFLWVFSYGGTQDDLIDPETDWVADVFPDMESLIAAGFTSQDECDLLAVVGPQHAGIVANNIPHFRKRQGVRSFREWQQQVNDEQRARRARKGHRGQGN